MSKRLTPTQARNLIELARLGPYWTPVGAGEWQSARALERRGYLAFDPSRGRQPYELTDAGRAKATELLGTAA